MISIAYTVAFEDLEKTAGFGHPFYVRCASYADVTESLRALAGNSCFEGVVISDSTPLCFVPFSEEWQGKDVILKVPAIGSLRMLLGELPLLKGLQLRICLPSGTDPDLIKVLSSSGLWCCVDYRSPQQVDWSALHSLADYSYSGSPAENRIEPFECVLHRYHPEMGAVIPVAGFERFDAIVELVADGDRLKPAASSLASLAPERLIGEELPREQVLKQEYSFQYLGVEDQTCRECQAFRICRSAIPAEQRGEGACAGFFEKLMSQVEQRQQGGCCCAQ